MVLEESHKRRRPQPKGRGAAALLLEARPGLTPDQVKNVLEQTARAMTKDDGTPFSLWEVGAGYLDAYAAVRAVMR